LRSVISVELKPAGQATEAADQPELWGNCLSLRRGSIPAVVTRCYEHLTQRYFDRFHYETQITTALQIRECCAFNYCSGGRPAHNARRLTRQTDSAEEEVMPAVTAEDILVLPRITEPDQATAADRPVLSVTTAPAGFEGEGFPVRRAFAGVDLSALDPFIHMDQMGEVDYAPGEPKGTSWHPHRGFETVTYIIDGTFRHQDSNGGGGLITNGDTQWMTAGGGLLHIEEPPEALVMSGGLFHGFQLWVNLPSRLKMTSPRYQDIRARQVALLSSADGGALVRVIAGEVDGHQGPGVTHTPITLLHVTVEPGAEFRLPWRPDFNALGYVLAGSGTVGAGRRPVRTGQLAVFGAGDVLTLGAQRKMDGPSEKLDILVLGGEPIREPVAAYGPFVMNTRAELVQAFEDYQAGRLGSIPAVRTPLPEEPHPGHDVL
jgi:redox-sensitive bicupin YhaK (pirin superfamily)